MPGTALRGWGAGYKGMGTLKPAELCPAWQRWGSPGWPRGQDGASGLRLANGGREEQ